MTNTVDQSSNSTLKRNEYPDASQYTFEIQSELNTEANKVKIVVALYVTDGKENYQSQIENAFANTTYNKSYKSGEIHQTEIIGC